MNRAAKFKDTTRPDYDIDDGASGRLQANPKATQL
jgi:hypothetical protein